jgi:hypothetical protein
MDGTIQYMRVKVTKDRGTDKVINQNPNLKRKKIKMPDDIFKFRSVCACPSRGTGKKPTCTQFCMYINRRICGFSGLDGPECPNRYEMITGEVRSAETEAPPLLMELAEKTEKLEEEKSKSEQEMELGPNEVVGGDGRVIELD